MTQQQPEHHLAQAQAQAQARAQAAVADADKWTSRLMMVTTIWLFLALLPALIIVLLFIGFIIMVIF